MNTLLTVRDVHATYVRGPRVHAVLRGVSFEVHAGDFVAIYGQRGAGKTSLLRIAAGLQMPGAGSVAFDGRDLAGLSAGQLARVHREGIGWVARTGPESDELSVMDYVALPLLMPCGRKEAYRRASETLLSVGVSDCAAARWSDLSDAERAQVALAHALVRKPRLLVLDDPTACLDVIERGRFVARLRSLADTHRVGVLMAVPDLGATRAAHEVLSLSGGRLLTAPTSGSVLSFPGSEQSA